MNLKEMSNEELVEVFQNSKCKLALDQLYENNKGMIFKVVNEYKNYDNMFLNFENYLSSANIGFMKAVNGYKRDNGYKFVTLLAISSKREIQRLFIDKNRKKRDNGYMVVSLQSKISPEINGYDFNEVVSYENEMFNKPFSDLNELYVELKPLLTDKQLIVLDMLNDGMGEVLIAEKLSTSRQNIHARIEQIRRKIIKHNLA